VNNETRPYFEQVFWAGLAGVAYLPATVIPTGPNDRGLPIGVQLIGPEYGDLTTMGAARLLEAAGFGFTPPPGY
jgi:amidase